MVLALGTRAKFSPRQEKTFWCKVWKKWHWHALALLSHVYPSSNLPHIPFRNEEICINHIVTYKPPLLKILDYQIISTSNKDIQKQVVAIKRTHHSGLVDYSGWWKVLMELDLAGGRDVPVLMALGGASMRFSRKLGINDESWDCLFWLEINIFHSAHIKNPKFDFLQKTYTPCTLFLFSFPIKLHIPQLFQIQTTFAGQEIGTRGTL